MAVLFMLLTAMVWRRNFVMARPHRTEEGYAQHFWAAVDKTGECWIWTRSKLHFGHGQFYVRGRRVQAHRFAYQLENGQVQDGEMVLHRCNNPSCVRPAHLYIGTHADNMRDKRAAKTSRGERNPSAKLSEADVREIRRLRAEEGLTYKVIAKRFGVSLAGAYFAATGWNWGHV